MSKSNKRIPLIEQAELEEKRRQLESYGKSFDPDEPYSEQIKRVLFNIEWTDKQKAFIDAKQYEKWLKGGYKSGKSFTGIAYDIWLAYVNRPYTGLLIHPTADGLTVTILPLIEQICNENKIEFTTRKLATKIIVTFKFGISPKEWGRMILASGDKPSSLKGPKVAWVHIDEPLIMKEEVTEVGLSRNAEAKGKLLQVIYTGTPEPVHMQWGYDIAEKEHFEDDDLFIETVSTREIQDKLPPGFVNSLIRKYTADQQEAFIDGKHVNVAGNRCYTQFKKPLQTYDPLTIEPLKGDIELILSFDFNVKQMSAALLERAGKWVRQPEEYRIQSRSDTSELTNLAIERMIVKGYLVEINGKYYTKHKKSLIISGDASGKSGSSKSLLSDYQIIQTIFEGYKNADGKKVPIQYEFIVPESNPAVRDRVNYVNKRFELLYFIISNECTLSIRDREQTRWKMGAVGFSVDKSKDEISHLADAADYGVYNTQELDNHDSNTDGVIAGYRDR